MSQRLSPIGQAEAHAQLGFFTQRTKRRKVPAGTVPVAQLAETAGDRGVSAAPTPGARRAANYRAQRAGRAGGFVGQLTPAQAKRLRKKAHQHADGIGQAEHAAFARSGLMTGADYDRMRAAQVAGRIRRGYAG